MEISSNAVREKNGKTYVPISLSYFLSTVGECRYSCGNRRYLPTAVQHLSRIVGAVVSGCAAALLYTAMNRLGAIEPTLLIHGLTAFDVFLSFLILGVSQWLPLRFLPWRVQEASAVRAADKSDKKERVYYSLLPLLCALIAGGLLGFLLSR